MKNSSYQKEPLTVGPLFFDGHDIYGNQEDLSLIPGFSCLGSGFYLADRINAISPIC